MGVIIHGTEREIPGIPCVPWTRDPSIRLVIGQDGCKRRGGPPVWCVWHTTRGQDRKRYLPGLGPAGQLAEANAHYWRNSPKSAGAHLILDHDGTLVQTADLADEVAYGASWRNGDAINVEIAEGGSGPEGVLYDGQLDVAARLALWLSEAFPTIPKVCQSVYHGHAIPALKRPVAPGGGHIQHCDCDNGRSVGDAGPELRARMIAAGLAPVDFAAARP